jgi:uncharacterized protein (UPF0210 family)
VEKFELANVHLQNLRDCLVNYLYEVQTIRISLNPFENWNPNLNMDRFEFLVKQLEVHNIQFCTIGGIFHNINAIQSIPSILNLSNRLNCCMNIPKPTATSTAPDINLSYLAANVSLKLAHLSGDLSNFRFGVSFHCPPNIPFFPCSYMDSNTNHSGGFKLSIGLENADLLFISYFGANTLDEGRDNLIRTLTQALNPIESIVVPICKSSNIEYLGIDPSINPGIKIIDSVGAGIEHILQQTIFNPYTELHQYDNLVLSKNITGDFNNSSHKFDFNQQSVVGSYRSPSLATDSVKKLFGSTGTLAAVSSITSALKEVQAQGTVKLCGYCGLMLPVMEDEVMAERVAQVLPDFASKLSRPFQG